MHLSYYQTFPARVHPDFVDAALRFTASRFRRKTEEKHRLEVEQKYFYTSNREKMLERKIVSRSLQLERAQSSRMRRLQEIRSVSTSSCRSRNWSRLGRGTSKI